MEFNKDTKILIVGLGLIGGSYAQALKSRGYEVGAIVRSEKTLNYALENNIISHGRSFVDGEYISKFDLIVFALYPTAFVEWLKNYQQFIKSGAILTDVTGIKCYVMEKVNEILRSDIEFIGAHPMAGKEVSGVQNADKNIFTDANYVVTPTPKNSSNAVEVCKKLGAELGFKNISELSPEKHDEIIGYLSQLTHCIAVSLMACRESEHMCEYTGNSFRDLTRISKLNDEMWSELFLLNRDELLSQMDMFINAFEQLRSYISEGDRENIRNMMRLSTKRREFFDRKENEK